MTEKSVTDYPGHDPALDVRKRFSSISLVKAFIVTFFFMLFCIIPIVAAFHYLEDLNAELVMFYLVYLVPLLLYVYAIKKHDLSLTAIFTQRDPSFKSLWLVVPLLIFTIGVIWVTIVLLNALSPGIAESYLNWLLSFDPFTITAETTFIQFVLIFIVISIIAPVVEEVIFRGIMLERLGQKYGYTSAVFTSSLIFGVLHADIIGAFLFGVVLCVVYLHTKSLMMPVLIHAVNNATATLLIFFEDKIGYEAWETVQPYIEHAWIGFLVFILAAAWILVYLKQNWHVVKESEPFAPLKLEIAEEPGSA
jgi:uncharacterized protein